METDQMNFKDSTSAMHRKFCRVICAATFIGLCSHSLPAAATDMTPVYQLLLFGKNGTVDDHQPAAYDLNLEKLGNGTGAIDASPAGTSCGATCMTYDEGTTVTLSATADEGSTFAKWSGACSGSGECVVTMDENKSVTATFTAPVDENEFNDTRDTALAVSLDSTITGGFDANDRDWFQLDVDGPETVTVHFVIPSDVNQDNPPTMYLEIWEENGTEPFNIIEFLSGDSVNVSLPAAGRFYFVVVAGDVQGALGYELTLLSNSGDFDPAEEETNDNAGAANDIPFDKAMNGNIMRLDDEDWYLIDSSQDRTVTIAFSGGHLRDSMGDWEVLVYKGGDTGEYVIARVEAKEGSEFMVPVTAAEGPYYLVVRDMYRSNDETGFNETPYRVTVRSNDGVVVPVVEQEANDDFSTATDTGDLNTSMAGQLMSKEDKDWFRFSGNDGDTISAQFSTRDTDGRAGWLISLHRSDGTQVCYTEGVCWAWGTANGGSFETTLDATGDYYLQVQYYTGNGGGDYFSSGYTVTVDVQ
jgi:hypothetical protein